MHSITIAFGNSSVWVLLYKTKEAADIAWNTPRSNGLLILRDDFGNHVEVKETEITGILHEDMEQSKLGAVERVLHQMRAQAVAEKMAASDPALQAGLSRRQANPILTPFGLNSGRVA